jgi:hypothetical protein
VAKYCHTLSPFERAESLVTLRDTTNSPRLEKDIAEFLVDVTSDIKVAIEFEEIPMGYTDTVYHTSNP